MCARSSGRSSPAPEVSDEDDEEDDEDTYVPDEFPLTAAPLNFTAAGHYAKLREQRRLLRLFGKNRVLTMIKSECKVYLRRKQWKTTLTPPQRADFRRRFYKALPQGPQGQQSRKPAGFTTELRVDLKGKRIEPHDKITKEFNLRQNLKDTWEVKPSEHLPGSLGVFAKKDIPLNHQRTGLDLLMHLIPMPGLIMTSDAANVANREFECPTQMAKADLSSKDSFAHKIKVPWKDGLLTLPAPDSFTLIGDPMCRGAIINSAAHTHATPEVERTLESQNARTNCQYAQMNVDWYRSQKAPVLKQWFLARNTGIETHTNYAVHVRLIKDIKKGDELLINYGGSFFEGDHASGCERCQLKFDEREADEELLQMYGATEDRRRQTCIYKDEEGTECSNWVHRGCSQEWVGQHCSVHSAARGAAAAAASAGRKEAEAPDLDEELGPVNNAGDQMEIGAMANLDELMLKVNLRH
jgi:hypothetical protein